MFSKYEVYTTTQSIYCYTDTNVLKNKLNIKDFDLLKKAEEEITAVKLMELLQNPIKGNFTKTHFFNINRFIFEDIYFFAGKLLKEQISKYTTMFYPPNLIDEYINRLFTKIKSENMLKANSKDDILNNLAYIMSELNIIHPFREGNGRTIREFIRLMAKKFDYSVNWGNISKDEILEKSIVSVDNYKILINMLEKCIDN